MGPLGCFVWDGVWANVSQAVLAQHLKAHHSEVEVLLRRFADSLHNVRMVAGTEELGRVRGLHGADQATSIRFDKSAAGGSEEEHRPQKKRERHSYEATSCGDNSGRRVGKGVALLYIASS